MVKVKGTIDDYKIKDYKLMPVGTGFVGLKERTLSMIKQKAEQRYEALLNTNPRVNSPRRFRTSKRALKKV